MTPLAAAEQPGPASQRAYLRGGLPGIYRDDRDGLAMRFVAGLEEVIDPVVSVLDGLPAHFDVELAPPEIVTLIAAWLGLDVNDTLAADAREDARRHRALAREATSLVRARGTRAGLERLLELAFPGLRITVQDGGIATSRATAGAAPDAPRPKFTVTTGVRDVSPETVTVLKRVVRRHVPVHVPGRLRIGPRGKAVAL